MIISNVIDSNRTTQSNAPRAVDSGSQQALGKPEMSQSCGCPFAAKHEDTVPKEENSIENLLLAISNILRKLLS